jgi:hypothetical protein
MAVGVLDPLGRITLPRGIPEVELYNTKYNHWLEHWHSKGVQSLGNLLLADGACIDSGFKGDGLVHGQQETEKD